MNNTSSNVRGLGRLVVLLGLAAGILGATGSHAAAQSNASASQTGLVGVWAVQVTLRNCTTQAPQGPFNSLVTFHRGGTITESTASLAFAPGQRSPGHGTWEHQGGNSYRQHMTALILFDTAPNLPGTPGFDPAKPVSPGFFAGWVTVTHTVELSDADSLSSAGTNAFYRSDGTVYRTGCSTAIGVRVE
ncbi:MAG TPA: hypothetical protein VGQ37_08505 [Vicinamibacterales bacterium]|nr:hypothetical protein [Vicinamibacterales bacterium]